MHLLRDTVEDWLRQSVAFALARRERDGAVAEATAATLAEAGCIKSLDEIEDEEQRAGWRRELRRRRHAASIVVRDRHGIAAWTRPPRLSLQAAAGIGKTHAVATILGTTPEL